MDEIKKEVDEYIKAKWPQYRHTPHMLSDRDYHYIHKMLMVRFWRFMQPIKRSMFSFKDYLLGICLKGRQDD